jgi:hypothetical protein
MFHGADAARITQNLSNVGEHRMKEALEKHGLNGMSTHDVTKILTGRDRAGLSPSDMKKMVSALQDVGVASSKEGAGSLVQRVARTVAGKEGGVTLKDTLTESAFKDRMRGLARERRDETEAEERANAENPSMGVLDRMRTANARANQSGSASASRAGGQTIRETRDLLRRQLQLQPRMKIPPKPMGEEPAAPGTTFQA